MLRINEDPVGIKSIEHAIIDKAWESGWVRPQPAAHKTGKKVAVVGSGPAGLACAQQLARAGHEVTVFEKNDRIGGLLRYGIPDFKLEKRLIDRRLEQMRAEGVEFRSGVCVGKRRPGKGIANDAKTSLAPAKLLAEFDAVVLSGGAEVPRDLPIPGRELDGRALRDGVPAAAEQARRGRHGRARAMGARQARGGHRRRRYRLRLRRHLQPPRRRVGDQFRAVPDAA